MAAVTPAEVAVIQFPGVNCEYETARILETVGLRPRILRWNAPEGVFAAARAYVLPGGFSYQDRVRAGAISAHEPIMDRLGRAADAGMPILGICNGAQVLVEAGLVPGRPTGSVRLALAANRMPGRDGYYSRWVHLAVTGEPCIFTTGLEPGTLLPMPMAHGEGRFTSADPEIDAELRGGKGVAYRYVSPDGAAAGGFPWNPNDSAGDAAGVIGGTGNVLALMPHPERAGWLWQVPPHIGGVWGERRLAWRNAQRAGSVAMNDEGPGRAIFQALARHLKESR